VTPVEFDHPRGPRVLILPPLFDEANRMRRTLVQLMRRLHAQEMSVVLYDLPGTGDSAIASVDARFEDWAAFVAETGAYTATIAVRGGAILDRYVDVEHRWRLAPETGARVLRDMVRATAMSEKITAAELEARARAEPTRLAGTMVHPALFTALQAAAPSDDPAARTVTLGDGDNQIAGSPLWRRAEPGEDDVLLDAMFTDILIWMRACGVL